MVSPFSLFGSITLLALLAPPYHSGSATEAYSFVVLAKVRVTQEETQRASRKYGVD